MTRTQEVNSVVRALVEFEEKLKPAVLADSLANRDLFVGWCRSHKVTQPTVANLIQCVKDLRDHLEWKIPMQKKSGDTQDSNSASRRNHAAKQDETWGQGESIMQNAAVKADHEKAMTILGDCRNVCESYSTTKLGRMDHGKSQRGRAALRAKLADLLKKFPEATLTLKQAEFIKAQVKLTAENL